VSGPGASGGTRAGGRILRRLAGVGIGLLVAIALVVLLPNLGKRGKGLPDYDDVHAFDPAREGGHLLPNLDLWVQGGQRDARVRFVTNSKGFRSRKEFAYAVPEGTCRILFLGDSFVDGMRTDQDDTIGAVLERELKERAPKTRYRDFEVMISGQNNPADAWYAFQEHGRKYAPQVVILGVTVGNDLTWQGYRRWMKPVPAEGGATRLRFDPGSLEIARENWGVMLPDRAFAPASAWDLWTRAEMKARRFLAERFAFAGHSIPLPTEPWWSQRGAVHAADFLLSLGIFVRPAMPEAEAWFRDLEDVLAGFAAEVARSGATFVVVVFPERLQVDPGDWRLTVRGYGLLEGAFDLEQPDRRIEAGCRRLGVDRLDLLAAFRERDRASGGPLYRPRGDMHFDEAGQKLAAVELAEHLIATVLR
jgi:hypothetical protein